MTPHPPTPQGIGAPACPVCRDTGIVQCPEQDGTGMYETACPERVHDGQPCPQCGGSGYVEGPACNCGVGPAGYYGMHERYCGMEPCPLGCPFDPPRTPETRPTSTPVSTGKAQPMSDDETAARLEEWRAIEEKMQAGHKLRDNGKPFTLTSAERATGSDRAGVGLCECGATSRKLYSDVSRRRWHGEHLDSLGIGHRAVACAFMDGKKADQ